MLCSAETSVGGHIGDIVRIFQPTILLSCSLERFSKMIREMQQQHKEKELRRIRLLTSDSMDVEVICWYLLALGFSHNFLLINT